MIYYMYDFEDGSPQMLHDNRRDISVSASRLKSMATEQLSHLVDRNAFSPIDAG